MRVAVAQLGARRHYAVPVALHRAGMLDSCHTDWCVNRGLPYLVSSLLPRSLCRGKLDRLHDRRVPSIPSGLIHNYLWHSVRMEWLRRRPGLASGDYWLRANANFGKQVVRTGFGEATAVYGFNAAAVEIFAAARDHGLLTILDQTMAAWKPVQTLLEDERRRWPDWPLPTGESDPSHQLADREAREWELADLVICGSQHVVDSIAAAGGQTDHCRVVPYGYDGDRSPITPKSSRSGPLRVLFVGTVDLRKGIPYLLEAARAIDPATAQFRAVGPLHVTDAAIKQLRDRVDLVGPVPRSDVHQHYKWADVFVLPTLAEGSANVCYEAMSHGLPVITTPNAGSVVRDQVDGWIVPPRSSEAIVACLDGARTNRSTLAEMSGNAAARSAAFGWDRYMESLAATIRTALDWTQPIETSPASH